MLWYEFPFGVKSLSVSLGRPVLQTGSYPQFLRSSVLTARGGARLVEHTHYWHLQHDTPQHRSKSHHCQRIYTARTFTYHRPGSMKNPGLVTLVEDLPMVVQKWLQRTIHRVMLQHAVVTVQCWLPYICRTRGCLLYTSSWSAGGCVEADPPIANRPLLESIQYSHSSLLAESGSPHASTAPSCRRLYGMCANAD